MTRLAGENPLSGDFVEGEGRLLAALGNGSVEDLIFLLGCAADDVRAPADLKTVRLETLARQIARLGGMDQLLKMSGLRAADREQAIAFAVAELAKDDADAAESVVRNLPAGRGRMVATSAFLAALAERDPTRGVELLKSDLGTWETTHSFFQAWAKQDPQAAATAALGQDERWGAIYSVVNEWAGTDFPSALAWSESIPEPQRQTALQSCAGALIIKDPSAAIDFYMSRPSLTEHAGPELGRVLAKDPAAIERALEQLPPGRFRTNVLNGIAWELGRDPAVAVEWTKSLLPGEQEAAVRGICGLAGQIAPEEAFRVVTEKLEGDLRQHALFILLSTWAENDFDAAFAAARDSLEPETLQRALSGMFNGSHFYYFEPENRLRLLAGLPREVRSNTLKDIGLRLGGPFVDDLDLRSALSGEDYEDLVEGMLERISDPKRMMEFAGPLSAERKLNRVGPIVRALARDDPRRAAEFAMALPEREGNTQKREALEDLAEEWAYFDPAGAEAFVRGMPVGATKDAVARRLAEQLRTFDPAAAARVLGDPMETKSGRP